ncbi:MAG: hypothetical protein FD123_2773 [Bacteroidetes bacterium]|nr:MAG: hypothetical protein FD123_2773 [Bacteroidota bacterium]
MNNTIKIILGIVIGLGLIYAGVMCYLMWSVTTNINDANEAIDRGFENIRQSNAPTYEFQPFEKSKTKEGQKADSTDSGRTKRLQEDMSGYLDSVKNGK